MDGLEQGEEERDNMDLEQEEDDGGDDDDKEDDNDDDDLLTSGDEDDDEVATIKSLPRSVQSASYNSNSSYGRSSYLHHSSQYPSNANNNHSHVIQQLHRPLLAGEHQHQQQEQQQQVNSHGQEEEEEEEEEEKEEKKAAY